MGGGVRWAATAVSVSFVLVAAVAALRLNPAHHAPEAAWIEAGADPVPRSLAALTGVGPAGALVAIDPGHGGRDPGAIASDGTPEKHWTLLLARGLAGCLRRRGLRVALSRTADVYRSLDERARWADRIGADVLVSVHLNALPRPRGAVLEVYYAGPAPDPGRWEMPGPRRWPRFAGFASLQRRLREAWRAAASERLARHIHEALAGPRGAGLEGVRDRGVKRARFVVLRRTAVPAVLVEPTTLSDPVQAARLRDARFRAALAARLCEGIAAYLEHGRRVGSAVSE